MLHIHYLVPNLADPAVARRIAMLRAGGAQISVAGFTRSGAAVPALDVHYCMPLGQTFDRNFSQRLAAVVRGWIAARRAFSDRPAPDLIIARNLEMLPLARRLQAKWGNKPRIVYECLDIHRLLLRDDLVGRSLRWAEHYWSRHAALLITSSPGFLRNYFDAHSSLPTLLVENKVLRDDDPIGVRPAVNRSNNGVVRIGWFGALRCQRSLDALSNIASRCGGQVEVVLRGRPSLTEFRDFHRQVTEHPHLRFLGPYDPRELPQIYSEVQFSWAIDFFEAGQNSAWLLPNRLYEGCYHGAVPIAVAGTETAAFLVRHALGVIVPSIDEEALLQLVAELSPAHVEALAGDVAHADPALFSYAEGDCHRLVSALAGLRNPAHTQAAFA